MELIPREDGILRRTKPQNRTCALLTHPSGRCGGRAALCRTIGAGAGRTGTGGVKSSRDVIPVTAGVEQASDAGRLHRGSDRQRPVHRYVRDEPGVRGERFGEHAGGARGIRASGCRSRQGGPGGPVGPPPLRSDSASNQCPGQAKAMPPSWNGRRWTPCRPSPSSLSTVAGRAATLTRTTSAPALRYPVRDCPLCGQDAGASCVASPLCALAKRAGQRAARVPSLKGAGRVRCAATAVLRRKRPERFRCRDGSAARRRLPPCGRLRRARARWSCRW